MKKAKLKPKSERPEFLKARQLGIMIDVAALAKNVFSESPFLRMIARCGSARKMMRGYRAMKQSRRPQAFRQDTW